MKKKKYVTIYIDGELNKRWGAVNKKLNLTKSNMVEEYLEQILPILEQQTPNDMISSAMKEMAKSINATASLFDDAEHDQSVEDYKEMKRG